MNWFYDNGFKKLSEHWERKIYYKYNCHLIKGVPLTRSVRLIHPLCLVIGQNVRFGKNITIHQGVTIGINIHDKELMPTIEDDVTIYAGAVIVGGITIGRGSVIGANTTITKDVPPYSAISKAG